MMRKEEKLFKVNIKMKTEVEVPTRMVVARRANRMLKRRFR
jgi:hypothetical protein